MTKTIHLIPNAHIDPVWLWDSREGLNQGISTCRAVLDLMDEYPELTFIRGEAAIYSHIEKYDRNCFRRIQKRVEQRRWDIVGGTWVQPDANMPSTETFIRHFLSGIRYFKDSFGVRVTAGWSADCFGHSAGLPDILASAGIESYAFTRPTEAQVHLAKPAFCWTGANGGQVLAYRPPVSAYCTERNSMPGLLDAFAKYLNDSDMPLVACLYGLGNHGGGPSRRAIEDIRTWSAAHPEVKVVHSTLHGFFEALRRAIRTDGEQLMTTHSGELNFCLRGCYSSVARLKFAFRKTEAELTRAETTDAVISSALHAKPANLQKDWDAVIFNTFHDILPGTSIERATDEQTHSLASARNNASATEAAALNELATRIDTTVTPVKKDLPTAVPLLVWNPHPHAYEGHVELEESLDSRPIWAYTNKPWEMPFEVRDPAGKPVQFQQLATEHTAMVQLAWRKRAAIRVKLPPMGWAVYTMAYVENAKPQLPPVELPENVIRNEFLEIRVNREEDYVAVCDTAGNEFTRFSAQTVEDPWGSWGGMSEEPDSCDLSAVRETWKISEAATLERGPERFVLGVKLAAGKSELDLRIILWRGRRAADVSARVLWNERSARLKLAFTNAGNEAEFQVPGGTVVRPPAGEVPGGRWVKSGALGFASDALYNFDLKRNILRATVCRASRYANDVPTKQTEEHWLPVVDRGELKFNFILTPDLENLTRMANELERPPVVISVPPSPGKLRRSGSLFEVRPASLNILALKPAADDHGFVLRAQAEANCHASCICLGKKLDLGRVRKGQISSWRIRPGSKPARCNSIEERLS